MTDAAKLRVLVGVEGAAQASTDIQSVGAATQAVGKDVAAASRSVGEALQAMPNAAKTSVGETAAAIGRLPREVTAAAASAAVAARNVGGTFQALPAAAQVSVAQTAAAWRQLPMQMQDIAVSLAGGMNPLMVAMQQGPQITSSFGGIGATVRALGAAISPVAASATALAVGLGAAGVAAYQGSQEMGAYERALINTGNRIGLTSGQLATMADRIGQIEGVTEGQAADALAALAGTAGITRDRIEAITTTALQLESVGGPAVAETAKAFAELAKAPVEASIKLHEQTGFLTEATYRQIKALEEQGRRTEAARVAQEAYHAAMAQRIPQLAQNLGALERGWQAIANTAKWAWDKMLNVGREEAPAARLEALRKQIATSEAADTRGVSESRLAVRRQYIQGLKDEAMALEETIRLSQRAAQSQSAAVQAADAAIAADKAPKKASGPKGQAADPFAAERQAAREWAQAYEEAARSALDAQARVDGLSTAQARLVKFLQSTAYAGEGVTDAMREMALQSFYAAIAAEQEAAAQKDAAQARQQAARIAADAARTHEQWLGSLDRSADSVAQQVQALRDEAQAVDLAAQQQMSLAEAIQLVAIERLRERQVQMMGDEQAVAAIQREIDKRKELAAEIRRKDGREEKDRADKADQKWLEKYFATDMGDDLARSFDGANKSIGALLRSFTTLGKAQANYNEARKRAGDDAATLARADAQYQQDQLAGYASLAIAARGMFEEGSDGYQAMNIAAAAAGMAYAAAGIANQASGDPYTAFARMAAMAASMASLGFAVGGALGGGGGSSSRRPAPPPGTGTTLGNPEAASESISRSIDRLTEVDTLTMQYSGQMLATLRSIDAGINGLGSQVAQDLAGGFASGTIFAQLMGLQFYQANAQTIGDISANGLSLQDNVTYERAWMDALRAGRGNRAAIEAGNAAISPFAADFEEVLLRVADSLRDAAVPLGMSADQVQQALAGASVKIDTIELRGKTDEQISDAIAAALSKAGDQIATQVLPGFERFSQLGEAYYETITRVSSAVEEASAALAPLGLTAAALSSVAGGARDVGAELVRNSVAARESTGGLLTTIGQLIDGMAGGAADLAQAYADLVGARRTLLAVGIKDVALTAQTLAGAGGLDALVDSLDAYTSWALSDGERLAMATSALRDQFSALGLALPATVADYRALVAGIDISTDAGQRLLGQVLGLADGYTTLAEAQAAVAEERAGLEERLLELQGNTAELRARELARLDAGNRALQERIWAMEDEQKAAEALVRSGQSVAAFISELRGGSGATASLGQRRATYAADLSAAQAGDADATGRVVASARSLVEAIRSTAPDPIQLARDTARIAAQLAALPATVAYQAQQAGQQVAAPAPVVPGTAANVPVPVVPAAAGGSGAASQAVEAAALRSELAAMRREIEAMRAEMRARGDAVADNTLRTFRLLEDVSNGGDAFVVTSA